MPTPTWQLFFDEASSGTTPLEMRDAKAIYPGFGQPAPATPFPITALGTGAWGSDSYGKFLTLSTTTLQSDYLNRGPRSLASLVSNTQKFSIGWMLSYTSSGNFLTIKSEFSTGYFGISPSSATDWRLDIAFSGSKYIGDWASTPTGTSLGVYYMAIDTTDATANNRQKLWVNGFLQTWTTNIGITQNTTTDNLGALTDLKAYLGSSEVAAFTAGSIYFMEAFPAVALTSAQVLANTLCLWASSDSDPNTPTARLCAAGTSDGVGTDDVSSSTSDHSTSNQIVIAAQHRGRKVGIWVAYSGTTTGVTSITFNGSSSGVHQTVTSASGGQGIDYYEILDADLPSGAGTYTIAVTVDGASGVACVTAHYLEFVHQAYSANTGTQTGTSTSISVSTGSNATAASIVVGCLLDATSTDTPVSDANCLRLVKQATSSTIVQVADARYITTTAAFSMAWSSLTNSSNKRAVVVEHLVGQPPVISSLSPTDGATGQSPTVSPAATYDRNIAMGTTGNVYVKDLTHDCIIETIPAGDGRLSISSATLTINPTATLPSGVRIGIGIDSGVVVSADDYLPAAALAA